MKENSIIKKIIVGTFLAVPILSSIISTLHLVVLFNLGNISWMSLMLATAFELGSISALVVPSVLPSIKKSLVYTIFIVLSLMQIIGNVFSNYDYIFYKLRSDQGYLDSFIAFMSNFGTFAPNELVLWLSVLIGLPVPLIGLFFLKSWLDYLSEDKLEKIIDQITPENIPTVTDEYGDKSFEDTVEEITEVPLIIEQGQTDTPVPEISDSESVNTMVPVITSNNNLK